HRKRLEVMGFERLDDMAVLRGLHHLPHRRRAQVGVDPAPPIRVDGIDPKEVVRDQDVLDRGMRERGPTDAARAGDKDRAFFHEPLSMVASPGQRQPFPWDGANIIYLRRREEWCSELRTYLDALQPRRLPCAGDVHESRPA